MKRALLSVFLLGCSHHLPAGGRTKHTAQDPIPAMSGTSPGGYYPEASGGDPEYGSYPITDAGASDCSVVDAANQKDAFNIDALDDDDPECECDEPTHGKAAAHCKVESRKHSEGHGNGHCKYDC